MNANPRMKRNEQINQKQFQKAKRGQIRYNFSMEILVRVISDCNMVERIARACNGENSTHTIIDKSGARHRVIFSHSARECDYALIINRAKETHKIIARKVFALQQEPFVPESAKYALPAKNEWARDIATYRDCDVVFAFNEALFKNLKKTHEWHSPSDFACENLANFKRERELSFDAFNFEHTTFVKYPPLMYFLFSTNVNFSELCDMSAPAKNREISCIASFDKRAFHGHIERMKFVKSLQNIGEIDFFGRNTARELMQKAQGILPYKFSIAIENCAQSDYFSEKIMDCMLGFTIPIYCGAPNVEKYFPKNSFINFDIYESNRALEIISEAIHSDFYEKNFNALLEGRARCLEDYSMCNALGKEFLRDFLSAPSEKKERKIRAYRYPLRDRARRYYFLCFNGTKNILLNRDRKHKIRGIDR